jgi:Protein of unknown function (DUF3048) N-terminal domain/Protein of unknown function (DUF3048) C-terminal domain
VDARRNARTSVSRVAVSVGALVLASVGVVLVPSPARAAPGTVPAGWVLRVSVPDAIGGKTVIGQLTVDRATEWGYVTAYGCDDGIPSSPGGGATRSDLNYDGRITPAASNRLIVQADADGDVCFNTTARVDMIVDVNAVSVDVGITSFPNRRIDTRANATLTPQLAAGGVARVNVPEAIGGKTVIGQLTVDRASSWGYVTAYGCDSGGGSTRSDLNYDGRITPAASNRLIVQADADGDICFRTTAPADLVIDINAATDVGITSFPNRRTDTRSTSTSAPQVIAGGVVRVAVPDAAGGKTVMGQLTVDRATDWGYVTAYGCDDGIPAVAGGQGAVSVTRSDLNYDGRITPAASNRLIVQADADGDVCLRTTAATDMIVDVNAVSGVGISSFPNQRTDTRTGTTSVELPGIGPVPQWPPYQPLPALVGVAALTGEPASADVTARPIVAVKIDNYRLARPQFGLELADAVIEENVEGVTRFIALFHTNVPVDVGPVRSARTGDLDLLAAMNRPVFGYSGANVGVDAWITSAASSGVLVDFSAQRNGCYRRTIDRPAPHNLIVDTSCATAAANAAGPARPLWTIAPGWTPPAGVSAVADSTFTVPMDGVRVEWTWDPTTGRYLRSQDGAEHLAASGTRITARTVVEVSARHVPSPVDSRSPNPITVGSGTAVVHRNGLAIRANWIRPTPYDPFSFTEAATGAPVPVDGGTTFIELVRAS